MRHPWTIYWLSALFFALLAAGIRLPDHQHQSPLGSIDEANHQSNVTWDEHSLFVNGKRVLIYSGEFHPFRLPVPTLWLDVLQKIRSLGFTAVSFYVDWALVEGEPGEIRLDGVFALEPFFEAAKTAGIYLIARPGPYINAEVSGGGFPGWLQRSKGHLRTSDPDFLNSTAKYVRAVCEIVAKAQITNGGPVILVQPENEYSHWHDGFAPDPDYWNFVQDQYRDVGIVVPMISNDAGPDGNNVPGSGAAPEIYGHDGYPLGFDCSNPDVWPAGRLPTDWRQRHMRQSPNTPYTIPEFQGGSFDPWGGPGFDKCLALTDASFERVFWKNLYSFGVTIYNVYMIYGGTNWGNMGHPEGYTSYDYGAAIAEDRTIWRKKYGEAKIQANGLLATPDYLVATPMTPRAGVLVSDGELTGTELQTNRTRFLVIRHTDYASNISTPYHLLVHNSTAGDLSIPQATDGPMWLNGRDSKIVVFDYDLFGVNMLYSTAEIFTKQRYDDRTVLVVYDDIAEYHEMAIDLSSLSEAEPKVHKDGNMRFIRKGGYMVVSWNSTSAMMDQVFELGSLTVWIINRESAYQWWVLPAIEPGAKHAPYVGETETSVIIKGGYLMRTVTMDENAMSIIGDLDASTTIYIIGGAPKTLKSFVFNGEEVDFYYSEVGTIIVPLEYRAPEIVLPDLTSLNWSCMNSLPEIQASYSDAEWTVADLTYTNNTNRNITTPVSLYSSDYGYHAGTLLFRGTFTANGNETYFFIEARGGAAFGFSVWLNSTFLGSFTGSSDAEDGTGRWPLHSLVAGQKYVFTIVLDNMGYDENWIIGAPDMMKSPRGILNYELDAHASPTDLAWKITGNLGGEHYVDRTRGPLNEGGMYAERQGYHLPSPPIHASSSSSDSKWTLVPGGPATGTPHAGISWFVTNFTLSMPAGYDIPLSLQLPAISSTSSSTYRAQIYVNGWQFGKYIHHVGPQTTFPVPEGIWQFRGENWVAVSLWAMDAEGARMQDEDGGGVRLVAGHAVRTGYTGVESVDALPWRRREGAY